MAAISDLYIEEVGVEKHPQLLFKASCWSSIASKKCVMTLSEEERSEFSSCISVCQMILDFLDKDSKAYVCKDLKGRVQAIMVLNMSPRDFGFDNYVLMDCLVTHPRNIRSSLNEKEIGRVRGAGIALSKFADNIVLELQKDGIYLSPLKPSTRFYKNRGYEPKENGQLVKTAQKIEQMQKIAA